MDVKNTHYVTKTEISVFDRQALDAERRRSPSLADKVLSDVICIVTSIGTSPFKTNDGNVDGRVSTVPGPDSVNRPVLFGPGTAPGSVPGLARLKWAIKRGYIESWNHCVKRAKNVE